MLDVNIFREGGAPLEAVRVSQRMRNSCVSKVKALEAAKKGGDAKAIAAAQTEFEAAKKKQDVSTTLAIDRTTLAICPLPVPETKTLLHLRWLDARDPDKPFQRPNLAFHVFSGRGR